MLIRFKFSNFRSFRDETVLDFVARDSSDDLDQVIDTGVFFEGKPLRLLRVVLLYGANASGKSNIFKALTLMRSVVMQGGFSGTQGRKSALQPFRLSSDKVYGRTNLEVTVFTDGMIYRYGFISATGRIMREYLYKRVPERRHREILVFNRDTVEKKWEFGEDQIKDGEFLSRILTDESLYLSSAKSYNLGSVSTVFEWFSTSLATRNMSAAQRGPNLYLQQWIQQNKTETISKALGAIDQTVTSVSIKHSTVRFPFEDDEGVVEFFEDKQTRLTVGRKAMSSGLTVDFELTDESNGSKAYLNLMADLAVALKKGRLTVFDEPETSLHNVLLMNVFEAMNTKISKTKDAQTVFITHDTSLFAAPSLRRDQIYFVEKNPEGVSELYSLYDLTPRPRDGNLSSSQYLSGKYGATPCLDDIREVLRSASIAD
jgi:AAA15 family ATPase/GTPase